jgi:plastocyanin
MNAAPDLSRRRIMQAGGGLLLLGLAYPRLAPAGDVIDIELAGSGDGSHVWFSPRGLLIKRGQTIRWVNTEAGNVHTTTAYHPSNQSKPLRMPEGAKPWNSGYLMPGESFSVTFDTPGVYDYFCVPHEQAGMVGRIIVDAPDSDAQARIQSSDAKLPDAAREGFASASIAKIMEARKVA